jgi:hypothetical protein
MFLEVRVHIKNTASNYESRHLIFFGQKIYLYINPYIKKWMDTNIS